MKKVLFSAVCAILFSALFLSPVHADTDEASETEELAEEVQNPVAPLISLQLQNSSFSGLGADQNGSESVIKFQPIIPFSLNRDWNLVARPIFSHISLQSISGYKNQNGLGDTQLQLFFTPRKRGTEGIFWGVGPLFYLPTAADAALGAEKWGVGACGIVLQQRDLWTVGIFGTHTASVGGNFNRSDISQTFLEPFISHEWQKGSSVTLVSENTYDWFSQKWTARLDAGVGQVLRLFENYFSVSATALCTLDSPSNISKWGASVSVTLLLPQ